MVDGVVDYIIIDIGRMVIYLARGGGECDVGDAVGFGDGGGSGRGVVIQAGGGIMVIVVRGRGMENVLSGDFFGEGI